LVSKRDWNAMQQTRAMMLLLFSSLACVAQGAINAAVGHGFLSGKKSGMQPELVANTLARVEDRWRSQAVLFTECNSTQGGSATLDCSHATSAFMKSCSTVVSAVISGSSGDRENVKEYLGVVCGEPELTAWKKDWCAGLAESISSMMSADNYDNREDFDVSRLCQGFWSKMTAVEATRLEQERAEHARRLEADRIQLAAAKKKAEEAAAEEARRRALAEAAAKAAAEKAAAEAAEKAKQEAKKRAEEAKKAAEREEAEAAKRQQEEAAHEVEEAQKRAEEAAARVEAKRKEAAAEEALAKHKLEAAKVAAEKMRQIKEAAKHKKEKKVATRPTEARKAAAPQKTAAKSAAVHNSTVAKVAVKKH